MLCTKKGCKHVYPPGCHSAPIALVEYINEFRKQIVDEIIPSKSVLFFKDFRSFNLEFSMWPDRSSLSFPMHTGNLLYLQIFLKVFPIFIRQRRLGVLKSRRTDMKRATMEKWDQKGRNDQRATINRSFVCCFLLFLSFLWDINHSPAMYRSSCCSCWVE